MHRLSRVMRGNSRSGTLPQRSTELAGVHELRLSVRIGIATGWLHYGSNVDNSLVTKRAKCEWLLCWVCAALLFQQACGGQTTSRQHKQMLLHSGRHVINRCTTQECAHTVACGMCPNTLNRPEQYCYCC
jgi:hypothetical protein